MKSCPYDKKASNQIRGAIYLMTAAGVIFRSELAILLGAEVLLLLARGKAYLQRDIIASGLIGATASLVLTVTVDSYFWSRFPLWPEWDAFYFNVVEGKSSAWGTSPWYFYLFDALPRLLLNPLSYLICIPTAIAVKATRQRSIDILVPLLAFVGIYSILPHKEWRFIVYVVPAVTAIAAVGASWIWTRRFRSNTYLLLSGALILSIIASFAASLLMLAVSAANYPGGQALTRLHRIPNAPVGAAFKAHIDNLSYQTGAVHFAEFQMHHFYPTAMCEDYFYSSWTYDKRDDPALLSDPAYWEGFDYALAEYPDEVLGSWVPVEPVYAFAGIGFTAVKSVEDDGQMRKEQAWQVREQDEESGQTRLKVVDEGTDYQLLKIQVPESWKLYPYASFVERVLRKTVTRGRWPVVKMKPRIWIMKRVKERREEEYVDSETITLF